MVFKNQGAQYNDGTYFEKKTDTQGEDFRFEILVDRRSSYGQAVNNLIATQGRTTIKTNFDLKFKVNGYVNFWNGRRYIINEIIEMEQELNPQTKYWFKNNPNTDYVLSLVEVEVINDNQ